MNVAFCLHRRHKTIIELVQLLIIGSEPVLLRNSALLADFHCPKMYNRSVHLLFKQSDPGNPV